MYNGRKQIYSFTRRYLLCLFWKKKKNLQKWNLAASDIWLPSTQSLICDSKEGSGPASKWSIKGGLWRPMQEDPSAKTYIILFTLYAETLQTWSPWLKISLSLFFSDSKKLTRNIMCLFLPHIQFLTSEDTEEGSCLHGEISGARSSRWSLGFVMPK